MFLNRASTNYAICLTKHTIDFDKTEVTAQYYNRVVKEWTGVRKDTLCVNKDSMLHILDT